MRRSSARSIVLVWRVYCSRGATQGKSSGCCPNRAGLLLNVHGDEPFLDPAHIATVVDVLLSVPANDTRVIGASLRTRLKTQEEATSRAKVKMIINPRDETVLYLSRALSSAFKIRRVQPRGCVLVAHQRAIRKVFVDVLRSVTYCSPKPQNPMLQETIVNQMSG